MPFQTTCASPVLHIGLSDQSTVTPDTLHLEGQHFMQNTFSFLKFFFPKLLVTYGHRLSKGWVNSLLIPSRQFIFYYGRNENFHVPSPPFLACIGCYIATCKIFLFFCCSRSPTKTRVPCSLARQVCRCCFTGSVAEGPLGVPGISGVQLPGVQRRFPLSQGFFTVA